MILRNSIFSRMKGDYGLWKLLRPLSKEPSCTKPFVVSDAEPIK